MLLSKGATMPEVILSHTTGTKTEPTFLHQNILPIQKEVRKELIVVKQSKNWYIDPAEIQGTLLAFWWWLGIWWTSGAPISSIRAAHYAMSRAGKSGSRQNTRATAPTKKAFCDVREKHIHAVAFGITGQLKHSFLGVFSVGVWGQGFWVFYTEE